MASLDKEKKSNRLLQSRRYTHDTLNASQEAFTEVLDLGSSEIYTHAGKIPSSGLPFSGSSQIGSFYQVNDENIMKYWYRQKLTKSNLNNEAWFFLSPTGSNSGIGAQLIDSNQQTSFISPKYSVASLATSTTEDSTPGYLAVLYKSSAVSHSLQTGSLGGGDIVSTNDYTFDYKTGVVQFTDSSVDPTDSQYVYMTVYQYVGKTLATGLELTGDVSSSVTSTGSFGRVEVSANTLSIGGTEIGQTVADNITNLDQQLESTSTPTFAGVNLNGDSSITGSLVITGNLTAQQYIVSSSVTYMTRSFSSGSTQFGDDKTDIHEFTGSIHLSGSLDAASFRYGDTSWKEFDGTNQLTGSNWTIKSTKGSGDLFQVVNDSDNLIFKATQDKLLVFGTVEGAAPTAVAGGMYYSGSDEWFLGYENSPT